MRRWAIRLPIAPRPTYPRFAIDSAGPIAARGVPATLKSTSIGAGLIPGATRPGDFLRRTLNVEPRPFRIAAPFPLFHAELGQVGGLPHDENRSLFQSHCHWCRSGHREPDRAV